MQVHAFWTDVVRLYLPSTVLILSVLIAGCENTSPASAGARAIVPLVDLAFWAALTAWMAYRRTVPDRAFVVLNVSDDSARARRLMNVSGVTLGLALMWHVMSFMACFDEDNRTPFFCLLTTIDRDALFVSSFFGILGSFGAASTLDLYTPALSKLFRTIQKTPQKRVSI